MIGRRVADGAGPYSYEPGDYGRVMRDGRWSWRARAPIADARLWGDLDNHEVTEHADGTITVAPSLLLSDGGVEYHGYLRGGIWSDA